MKLNTYDMMWITSIGITLIMSSFLQYNTLTLFGSVFILRGFIGIGLSILTIFKSNKDKK